MDNSYRRSSERARLGLREPIGDPGARRRRLVTAPAISTAPPTSAGLPRPLALVVVLAALVTAFLPAWSTVVIPLWLSPGGFYGHGLIIVALVASLLWRDRHAVFGSPEPGCWWYAVAAALFSAVWFVAWAADLQAVTLAAMVAVMLLAGSALLGRRSLWTFGAPFALIWFTVPMWSPIQPALQDIATVVVGLLVNLTGIAVFMEGNLVHIPAGVFEIQRGCSGLGFLLVSLSLCGYLALAYRPYVPRMLALVGIALLSGLAANWVRIFVVIVLAHREGMDHPWVLDHESLGWIVYAVMVFPLLWLGVRWLENGPSRPVQSQAQSGTASVSMPFLAAVVLASSTLPFVALALENMQDARALEPLLLPETAGEFASAQRDEFPWKPVFPEADHTDLATYRHHDGSVVQAFAASYASQREGREVVSIINLLGGEGWFSRGKQQQPLAVAGSTVPLTEQRFESMRGDTLCVWYWYLIGDAHAGTEFDAKIEQVKQTVLGRTDASLVAVATTSGTPSCEPVRRRLADVGSALIATP